MDINEIRRKNARDLASEEKFTSHFAKKINKSPAQVNNWIGKTPTKNIGPEHARHIEKCYKKPHGWLDQRHGISLEGVELEATPLHEQVPVINSVQAGEFADVNDPYEPGHDFPMIDRAIVGKNVFALIVEGNSMTAPMGVRPSFLEGEYIHVDFDAKAAKHNDFIIALVEGESKATFKQLKIEDGQPYLYPLNPSFQPKFENFKVLGTVKAKTDIF